MFKMHDGGADRSSFSLVTADTSKHFQFQPFDQQFEVGMDVGCGKEKFTVVIWKI